jgi:hypothetical protein
MDQAFFDVLADQESLNEALETRDLKAADSIYSELFRQQAQVIDDPYEFKSLLTPRRSGKTHTAIAYSVIECLRNPGAIVIIVTLTLKSAKRLYWNPILAFSDRFGLNLRRPGGVHHTNAEARFENGSQLFLMGAETKAEIEKLRGGSYDLVIVDECKSFSEHIFRELTDDILSPACQDRGGTLFILGTPGSVLAGPFYEATYPHYKDPHTGNPVSRLYEDPAPYWVESGEDPEWSRHTWTQKENTKTKNDLWKSSLKKKRIKRWADDNPTWLREHLGQWISMGDSMVYAYSRILTADKEADMPRCVYRRGAGDGFDKHGLSDREEWRYVLGMDLGYEDDLAIVVAAYSPTLDEMYIVYEFKQPHMIISQVASQIAHITQMFDDRIEAMVVDTGAGGKMLVESMNEMYGTFLIRAEKSAKNDYVELLNSDLHDGKLKVLADGELAHEWLNLQWDLSDKTKKDLVRSGKLKEDRLCANHLSDATLYTWRFCLHHFSRDRVDGPAKESSEWYDERDMEAAIAAVERREKAVYDGEWNQDDMEPDREFDREWNTDTSWLT